MQRIYQTYKDQAQFLLVYIREAHPGSVLTVLEGEKQVLQKIQQTSTLEERSHNAQVCTIALKLTMPAVVDLPDNRVNANYAGWPDRLVIVADDGNIAYYGGDGPRGFKPREIESWLKTNLPVQK